MASPLKQRRALLFPQALAVLTEDEGSRVRMVDFLDRRVLSADGVLARDLLAAIDGGEPGPLLASLGRRGGSIARLRGAEALPLTAEAALRLQGFETLFLELTLQCTERCVHCYAAAGPERRERLSRETCLEVLEDAAGLGFRRVQLTGGDALLVPHLEELLTAARALGFEMREVFTNGLLLDEARLASLAERGASFAFSLYAADPAVHDAITRIPGSHARTCDAIRRACARDLEVRVAVVELEQNAGHAEAAVALARSLGASACRAATGHAVGRGSFWEGRDPAPPVEEEAALEEPQAQGCAREEIGFRGVLCVAGDGSVYPCVFNREDRLGRVTERRLRDIVAAPELPAGWVEAAEFLREVRRRLQCSSCQCTAWALRALEAASGVERWD